ncbi:MAG: Na+/H+ antiporter subunit E [Pseudomonadota bacterium]
MRTLFSISGRRLGLALTLTILWLLLSGYLDHATLIGFGVFSIGLIVWIADRAEVIDEEGVPTSIFPRIIGYMGWLFLEIGKANVMVSREALRPVITLSPKMFRVPANQASDLTRTIFGNSVTLTPGTVTVDVREDCLLIHALTEDFADEAAIADMGRRVTRLEPNAVKEAG